MNTSSKNIDNIDEDERGMKDFQTMLKDRIYFMREEIAKNRDEIHQVKQNQVEMGKAFEDMEIKLCDKLESIATDIEESMQPKFKLHAKGLDSGQESDH